MEEMTVKKENGSPRKRNGFGLDGFASSLKSAGAVEVVGNAFGNCELIWRGMFHCCCC
jgi:hypothetical protein